jgi:guanylate kinase
VMIGPGGAGKNAIMKAIISRHDRIRQLATATTRPTRANEKQGREHLFVSFEQFCSMIKNDQLLEFQEVTPGKLYGIPRQTVTDCLLSGEIRMADIEVLGAQKLVESFPDNVVQIFVTVPGSTIEAQLKVLRERMRRRDDGITDIEQRLERARTLELPYQRDCDYLVVNDTLTSAIKTAETFIKEELARRHRSAIEGFAGAHAAAG